ncbi:MAG: hypothetical protein KIS96_11805 [Bauldia sp.]|nr:hypothetical protein [Bauldia sp.]
MPNPDTDPAAVERAAVVAWLRALAPLRLGGDLLSFAADQIERLAHLKERPDGT